jgi:primary-amine oxidase
MAAVGADMSLSTVCRNLFVLLFACAPAFFVADPAAQAPPAPGQQHPLDPLTAAEIDAAAALIKAEAAFPAGALFATLVLKEPNKSDVQGYRPGQAIARQAFAVVLDRPRNRTFETVVDLTARRVVSWTEVKGVQPAVLEVEYDTFVRVVKEDARWQAAMRARGIDDFDAVQVDFWPWVRSLRATGRDGCFARSPISRVTRRTSTRGRSRGSASWST